VQMRMQAPWMLGGDARIGNRRHGLGSSAGAILQRRGIGRIERRTRGEAAIIDSRPQQSVRCQITAELDSGGSAKIDLAPRVHFEIGVSHRAVLEVIRTITFRRTRRRRAV
jgi:hypothetical protein